jgi:hypothetical protein
MYVFTQATRCLDYFVSAKPSKHSYTHAITTLYEQLCNHDEQGYVTIDQMALWLYNAVYLQMTLAKIYLPLRSRFPNFFFFYILHIFFLWVILFLLFFSFPYKLFFFFFFLLIDTHDRYRPLFTA